MQLGSFIGFACLLTIPWWASSFWLSEAQTWLIYVLAGLSLKLLSKEVGLISLGHSCLLYTSPSPRDATLSRMPSSA